MIQRATNLSSQREKGTPLVLQLEVETNVLNASIDCLSTVDGYVWSVSSDFRLRQWDIRSTELAVGSGARAEGVVRSAPLGAAS